MGADGDNEVKLRQFEALSSKDCEVSLLSSKKRRAKVCNTSDYGQA